MVRAKAPGPERMRAALRMLHTNSPGPTSLFGAQSPAPGPQARGSLRPLPTSLLPPHHEAFRGRTVSVDEDVHGLRGQLLLHGRLRPADDLQHRAVLLGSHPVDDLPLSAALETEQGHKVRKLLGTPPPPLPSPTPSSAKRSRQQPASHQASGFAPTRS